jgi:uncharacterized membrane protein
VASRISVKRRVSCRRLPPLRRYTLNLANEPLYLAAVIGIVALPWLASATLLPGQQQRPVWDRRAMGPFLIAGTFETLGILLVIVALSVGHVVVVSPIVATSPLWVVLGSSLFLRDVERLTLRTILGAVCVVAGTIAISIVR